MFRLSLMIALSLLLSATLGAQAADRAPNETRTCAKTLAKGGGDQLGHQDHQGQQGHDKMRAMDPSSHEKYEAALQALYEAALRALEELKAKAESQLATASGTVKEDQTLLIKALRDTANEVLSASESPSNDQRRKGTHQAHEVPQVVLTAFELARELESLQSPLSSRRLGSTWLQTIVPIDTPRSVLYEANAVSERPSPSPASSPIQRIEILAAKELLLYRGQQLVSTLYGAIYLLSYKKEGDSGIPQIFTRIDRKRMEFHKVDLPAKPSSQRAKKMRITALSDDLWADIPELDEGEVQILVIADSVETTIPLAAAAAARRKAERNQKKAQDFPDFFWKFVTEK